MPGTARTPEEIATEIVYDKMQYKGTGRVNEPDFVDEEHLIKLIAQAIREYVDQEPVSVDYEPWIGVDLDGTLAHTGQMVDPRFMIGFPIQAMVNRVKIMLAQGTRVKIFTARMSENPKLWQKRIGDWCEAYIGTRLEATNCKDFGCIAIFDDIAIGIHENTGLVNTIGTNGEYNITIASVMDIPQSCGDLRFCGYCRRSPYKVPCGEDCCYPGNILEPRPIPTEKSVPINTAMFIQDPKSSEA